MFFFDVPAIMPLKPGRPQRKRTVPRRIAECMSSESEDVVLSESDLDNASSESSVGDAPQSAPIPCAISDMTSWNTKKQPNI